MSYQCDLCSNQMSSRSDGQILSDLEMGTYPHYWEVITEAASGNANMLGMQIQLRMNDTSGFSVCPKCAATLSQRATQLSDIGLRSLDSSGLDKYDKVMVVAGVVWQKKTGTWPSCLDASVVALRDRVFANRY